MLKNTRVAETWTANDVVSGLVALNTANGTVESMAQEWYAGLVYNSVGSGIGQLDMDDKKTVKDFFKSQYEQAYKDQSGATTMPSAYRSSKSVVCKAVRLGVELLDESGKARGKTEVEKECKELEGGDKSNVDKITTMLGTVSTLIDKARDEGEDLRTVQALLADLHSKCS